MYAEGHVIQLVSLTKKAVCMPEGNGFLAPGYDVEKVRDAIKDNVWLHYTNMKAVRESPDKPLVLVKGTLPTLATERQICAADRRARQNP